MNIQQRLFAFFSVAVVVLATSFDASALTIGRVRGSVLLGSPLDLTVQLQFAPDEDASSNCFSADIWYGEVAQPASQITLTPEPGRQAREVQLRVRSATRLDEPTVKVALGVGCTQKISRTFQLLAEVLTDSVEPIARKSEVHAMNVVPAKGILPATSDSLSLDSVPAKSSNNKLPEPASRPKAKAIADNSASGKAAGRNSAADKRVEFQIEEIEKRLDTFVREKLEASQAGLAANDARLRALDSDLKGLQALAIKNQKNVELLAQTLERTNTSDSLSGLVYALVGALVLCMGGIGYFVWNLRNHQSGSGGHWWSASTKADEHTDLLETQNANLTSTNVKQSPDSANIAVSKNSVEIGKDSVELAPKESTEEDTEDIDLAIDLAALESQALSTASVPLSAGVIEPERPERRDFAHSTAAALRALNTKEMMDIRQQAEFFMALGQHDDAIGLLQNSINNSEEANPLVYLDLLKLLHTLGRKQDFDDYAREFNFQFTGRAPEFESFNLEGSGLDEYTEICSQIVELWPGDDAIDYIEQCLVRTPEDDPDSGFDLEAFRDLLMLHGILKRLDSFTESSMVPFSTSRTPSSQLGELKEIGQVANPASVPTADATSDHEHLDFSEFLPDLTAPAGATANKESASTGDQISPAISPAAYSDLDLGGKPGNLIDFDLSGLDDLDGKKDKS